MPLIDDEVDMAAHHAVPTAGASRENDLSELTRLRALAARTIERAPGTRPPTPKEPASSPGLWVGPPAPAVFVPAGHLKRSRLRSPWRIAGLVAGFGAAAAVAAAVLTTGVSGPAAPPEGQANLVSSEGPTPPAPAEAAPAAAPAPGVPALARPKEDTQRRRMGRETARLRVAAHKHPSTVAAAGSGGPNEVPAASPSPSGERVGGGNDPFESAAGRPVEGRAASPQGERDPIDRLLASAYEQRAASPDPGAERAEVRRTLIRGELDSIMKRIAAKARRCRAQHGGQGTIPVAITVGRNGVVTATELSGSLADTAMGRCAQGIIEATVFPASSGIRFDYVLDLR